MHGLAKVRYCNSIAPPLCLVGVSARYGCWLEPATSWHCLEQQHLNRMLLLMALFAVRIVQGILLHMHDGSVQSMRCPILLHSRARGGGGEGQGMWHV